MPQSLYSFHFYPLPVTATQTGVSAWVHGSDPAVIAAPIGLAGVIVGALLAGACALK